MSPRNRAHILQVESRPGLQRLEARRCGYLESSRKAGSVTLEQPSFPVQLARLHDPLFRRQAVRARAWNPRCPSDRSSSRASSLAPAHTSLSLRARASRSRRECQATWAAATAIELPDLKVLVVFMCNSVYTHCTYIGRGGGSRRRAYSQRLDGRWFGRGEQQIASSSPARMSKERAGQGAGGLDRRIGATGAGPPWSRVNSAAQLSGERSIRKFIANIERPGSMRPSANIAAAAR